MTYRYFARKFNDQHERGDALVLVLTSIFLVGIVVISLVSVTLTATAKSAATRAHSQALAAAEGGAELYLQHLLVNEQGCFSPGAGTVGNEAADVLYEINETRYKIEGDATWHTCADGQVLDPENTDAVQVVVTGWAVDAARQIDSANSATIERVFQRGELEGLFNRALYGENQVMHNTAMTIQPDGPSGAAPDVVSRNKWTCNTKADIGGSVVALGGIEVTNIGCRIRGDLYVGTKVEGLGSGLIVDGNVYVNGNLSVNTTIKVGGDLLIKGNFQADNKVHIGGETRIHGTFDVKDNDATSTMTGTVWAAQGLANPDDWNTKQTVEKAGEKLKLSEDDTSGPKWQLPEILTDTELQDQEISMPRLTMNDPIFSTFQRMTVQEFNQATGRSGEACNGNFYGTVQILVDTVIDLSGCNFSIDSANVTFELHADLVIQSNQIKLGGTLNFHNMSASGKHSVYLVAAPESPWTTCFNSAHNVYSESGEFNLGRKVNGVIPETERGRINVLMYAANEVDMKANMESFYGQVYGCKVVAPTAQSFVFSPVGADDTQGLMALEELWTRDITH